MKPSKDIESIVQVVQLYFEGTYHGDADMLNQAFHPHARITGIVNDEVCDWTLPEFIARVTKIPTAAIQGEKFDKEIISIDITKNAAMVKTRVLVGPFIFFDYINFLKINNRWIIRHKSFTN